MSARSLVLHKLTWPCCLNSFLNYDPINTQGGNVRGYLTTNENIIQCPQASLLQNGNVRKEWTF